MRATRPETSDIDPLDAAGEAMRRAESVAPRVAAAADRIEAGRELPPGVLDALHDARLFRLMLPRALAGDEAPPGCLARVTETIAAADASTAWCLGQAAGCAMAAAYLDREAARRVFGPREAVLAWGAGAEGRAVPVEGGYRVTGRWMFASGSRHATWLGGHCRVIGPDGEALRRADGRLVERTALFPRAAAAIEDVWQVVGLRGTGSDSYAVSALFVPAELTLDRDDPAARREAGALYRLSTTHVYASAFAGVALGVARGLLDALLALAREKTPRGARSPLRDDPVFLSEAARLEAEWRAARAFLHETLEAIWREVAAGEDPSLDRRADLRLASTWAINRATDVSEAAYRAAGATAIFDSRPFERRLRDAHAVSQQIQGRASHFETVGRHRLGHDLPPLFF